MNEKTQLAALTPTEIEKATGIFQRMKSIPRLMRDVIVTEKIDGTIASIFITEDGQSMYTASRSRWITPADDNYGFAKWAASRGEELLQLLGPGHHFGEWYGNGIQRKYGLKEKRFALFNVQRWASQRNVDKFADLIPNATLVPSWLDVVPILGFGMFDTHAIMAVAGALQEVGSLLVPGFRQPEGIVIYHKAGDALFKYTFDKNDGHKGVA
jgi:hypothetical protein